MRKQITRGEKRKIGERILYGATDTRLRATWRALVPLIVALTIHIAGHLLVERVESPVLDASTSEAAAVAVTGTIFALLTAAIGIAAGAGLFVASRIDRRPVTGYGYDASGARYGEFMAGVLIGAAASVGAVGYLVARGDATVTVELTGVGVDSMVLGVVVLLLMLVFLLVNTLFEEVFFRAILIRNAADGLRSWSAGTTLAVTGAVAISLPVFGAFHLLGGGLAAVVTSAVAGILFAVAYVLTGHLELPIGVHFGGVALLSIVQEPVSTDPELTLPSLVVAEGPANLSLTASVEAWIVRAVIGVALVLVWVYVIYGDLSITDRIYTSSEGDRSR